MLQQDFERYTVYLVDNSSIDELDRVLFECESLDGANSFGAAAPRPERHAGGGSPLVVIRQPRPEFFSFAVSRNCGVRWSASDLLLFVNGDTAFDGPQTLRAIVDDFLHSPDVTHDWFAAWRASCGYPPVTALEQVPIESRFRRVFVHGAGSLLLVERGVFQQLGGYNELLEDWGYEDTDLAARLELAGFGRIEMTGVRDATQDDAEALRVQHFRVKDPAFTWMRNRSISDLVIQRFGVVCRACRLPGDSPRVGVHGTRIDRHAVRPSDWGIEPTLSEAVRNIADSASQEYGRLHGSMSRVTNGCGEGANRPGADLLHCNTLWIGSALGAVERACLRSFIQHGHSLTLYCYDEVADVPDGVEVADAEAIVPRKLIVRHERGSYALFANRFRYQLQALGRGLWIDADLYCLAPMQFRDQYLFGWQGAGHVNNAVLRLPYDSPVLPPLLEIFDEKTAPPWLSPEARAAALEQLERTGRVDLSRAPWGVAGPTALTYLLKEHGLEAAAQPESVFYPAHWTKAEWILDPSIDLSMIATVATVTVHLWNERIKHFKEKPAPNGSFLARLQQEGA